MRQTGFHRDESQRSIGAGRSQVPQISPCRRCLAVGLVTFHKIHTARDGSPEV